MSHSRSKQKRNDTDERSLFPLTRKLALDRASTIAFQNPNTSIGILSNVAAQISSQLADVLPSLLAESPDPDSAVILFDRMVSESPDTAQLLNVHNFLAHYAIVIFGHSRYLGETLIQNPEILRSFLRERNLDLSFSQDHFEENLSRFRTRCSGADLSVLLARFKRRELVRIALRDVLRIAPLAETTAEISTLADVLIAEALRDGDSTLQRRFGRPQHLDTENRMVDSHYAVLSLGKLGGKELNYSSDVDLMYIFSDGPEAPGAQVTNREYFILLSQHITSSLSRVTSEGPALRIDLRLRPQGREGELAISQEAALQYYASAAHDWERQALIKIRYAAGNIFLARDFIQRLQPLVYVDQGQPHIGMKEEKPRQHKAFNFEAINTALKSREKIDKRPRTQIQQAPYGGLDLKLDHGGIRDIEFLVQCLQRVYGGLEPWLRSGGTLFSLQKLHDKQHISGREFHELTGAYEFLRHLEHRLQLKQGQQTHQLPSTQADLKILQRSMEGYAPQEYRIKDLQDTVRRKMSAVAEIYGQIIRRQQGRIYGDSAEDEFNLKAETRTAEFNHTDQELLSRLALDARELHRALAAEELSPHARRKLFGFLTSAFANSQRYSEVVRHPHLVIGAMTLFESSDYLSDVLIRHPEEIVTLASVSETAPRSANGYLFASGLGHGRAAIDPVFEYAATSASSEEERLALLRKHFRHCIFAIGARDVLSFRGVYESLEAITAAAEDAIAAALAIAGSPRGLAIMAVGRLASRELDVFSDVDLIFVAEDERNQERLTKSAQQVIHTLSAYTRDGVVMPIDIRMRPGGGGDLIVTPVQLTAYFEGEAQSWEALTYSKLRFIAGSQSVGQQVAKATETLYSRYAADASFLDSIRAMRDKVAQSTHSESFKASPGGTYDIDFLTGYLLIKHRVPNKQGSLRERIWECASASLLSNAEAGRLDHAAELLRTVEHVVRLTMGKLQKWLPASGHALDVTQRLTAKILNLKFEHGLEAELYRTFTEVRAVYEEKLA